jgi:hypothetical protein
MRLGTGHPGATLVSLHTVRRVAPISANIWSRVARKHIAPLGWEHIIGLIGDYI